jgi:predicted nucleic acid-binding protein
VSVYLETSCLLKLLLDEPGAERVAALLQGETRIVVSAFSRLETLNVLQGMKAGGQLTEGRHRRAVAALEELLESGPFQAVPLPGDALDEALRQVAKGSAYCRTLDRLHLGTMAALRLRRLVTNDDQQAVAARALGFEVLGPA